ncbi:hypothetical protein PB01_17430 [Psychrobacillus glaciei]|uniref:Uncharacterized protein n=1 Tax=Psychrobacillus glaciei TaxID=2283160 RepID=A0A5J6SSA1_9BACI|nr:hypothetical protein [Psychrobacillus glaciei]QFG00440.1 hypothetical protein PB01_17430 [Psychrobacillus glaciei]
MSREENFIIIYDKFITEGEEVHLIIEELYLYGLLRKKENLEGFTETSMLFINQSSPIQFASDKQRVNKKIKELLISLQSKRIIKITDVDGVILNNFKPSDLLKIDFIKFESGFTKVSISKINDCTTMSDFYVYCGVARWINSGKGYFNSSYGRWGKILHLSKRHAIDIVNKAIENKIIYKNIGDYVDSESGGQKQQKLNQYSITPFPYSEKTVQTKIQESEVANEEFHSNRINSDIELIQLLEVTKVFRTYKDDNMKNIYPLVEDYVFFLLQLKKLENKQPTKSEKKFIEIAEKRIDRMKNNKKFNADFDKAKIKVKAMGEAKYNSSDNNTEDQKQVQTTMDLLNEMLQNSSIDEIFGTSKS